MALILAKPDSFRKKEFGGEIKNYGDLLGGGDFIPFESIGKMFYRLHRYETCNQPIHIHPGYFDLSVGVEEDVQVVILKGQLLTDLILAKAKCGKDVKNLIYIKDGTLTNLLHVLSLFSIREGSPILTDTDSQYVFAKAHLTDDVHATDKWLFAFDFSCRKANKLVTHLLFKKMTDPDATINKDLVKDLKDLADIGSASFDLIAKTCAKISSYVELDFAGINNTVYDLDSAYLCTYNGIISCVFTIPQLDKDGNHSGKYYYLHVAYANKLDINREDFMVLAQAVGPKVYYDNLTNLFKGNEYDTPSYIS